MSQQDGLGRRRDFSSLTVQVLCWGEVDATWPRGMVTGGMQLACTSRPGSHVERKAAREHPKLPEFLATLLPRRRARCRRRAMPAVHWHNVAVGHAKESSLQRHQLQATPQFLGTRLLADRLALCLRDGGRSAVHSLIRAPF